MGSRARSRAAAGGHGILGITAEEETDSQSARGGAGRRHSAAKLGTTSKVLVVLQTALLLFAIAIWDQWRGHDMETHVLETGGADTDERSAPNGSLAMLDEGIAP